MSLFHAGLQPALDSNGNPINGATWTFYLFGTLTPTNVFSTNTLAVSLGATLTADPAGRFTTAYINDAVETRAILKDGGGATIKDVALINGDGSTYIAGFFNALGTVTIPTGTNVLTTTGFHTLGKGAATYTRWSSPMAALPTWGQNVWWKDLADGSRWQLNETRPTSHMFGAYSDAARAYEVQTVSGTDDTVVLNKLTYYAESVWGNGVAILSRGAHRTSDTIHVGTGINGFRSVRLIGEVDFPWNTRHDAQTSFASSEIKAEKNDRPAVNVQAGRSNAILHVTIEGPLYAHIITNRLGRSDGTPTLINDVLASSWLPGVGAHTNGRYNSGAGVAVDAFSGVLPATGGAWAASTDYIVDAIRSNGGNFYICTTAGTSAGSGGPTGTGSNIVDNTVVWSFVNATTAGLAYPTIAYPDTTSQYGKAFTSELRMLGVKISGFTIGLAIQPCNADGNGDFVEMFDCSTTECIYSISIGNGQSRNVEVRNHKYIHNHTFITNIKHGKQRGKLGGPLDNISGGQSIQLFDLTMGFAGVVNFTNTYSEGLWRLGDAVGAGRIQMNCDLTLAGGGTTGNHVMRGLPRTVFGTTAFPTAALSNGTTETAIVLSGNIQVPTLAVFASSSVDTTDLTLTTVARDGSTTLDPWRAQANNALRGGLFAESGASSRSATSLGGTFFLYNALTGGGVGRASWDGVVWERSRRSQGCPLSAQYLAAVQSDTPVLVKREPSALDNASLTGKTLTGTTFTFSITAGATNRDRRNFSPGDIIWHESSGAVYAIVTRVVDAITAELLNGFLATGTTITFPNGSPILTEGTYNFYSGRWYIPDYPMFGDFTAASASVTNVGTAEAFFGVSADFENGDALGVNALEDFTHVTGITVSARDVDLRTITLSGNAAVTEVKRRLIFRRTA